MHEGFEPDRRIDVWLDKRRLWPDELHALRAIVQGFALTETFKWRGPVYMSSGGNILNLYEMKAGGGVGFFQGALLRDPGR